MLGRTSRRTRSRLEERGRLARALVLEARLGAAITTGPETIVSNTQVVVKMRLRVEPESEPAFEASLKVRLPQMSIPAAGSILRVVYDPEDTGSLMLDPELEQRLQTGLPPGQAAAAMAARQAMEHPGASIADVEAAMAAAGTGGPGGDAAGTSRLEELKLLADLRDRGALSEAEFEAQKARLLGGSG